MTNPTRDHYETLLADNYTWMFQVPFEEKVAEQRSVLEESEALPDGRRLAFDLGSGPGFQSVALSDIGFDRVVAVDLSPKLLAELKERKGPRAIETVECDLNVYLDRCAPATADMIVCMGDTLTHLVSRDEVRRMFGLAARALSEEGAFVLSYRDMSFDISDDERFIPVGQDKDRILTCVLEYGEESVTVHDLLYENTNDRWRLRKSAYDKLRLPVGWVSEALRSAGFGPVRESASGRLTVLVAKRA